MRRLLLPSFIVVIAFLLHSYSEALVGAPWVSLSRGAWLLTFVLAWRLRRGRIAWAVVAIALTVEAVGWWREVGDPSTWRDLRLAVGWLLPLSLATLTWLPEWWVASRAGLARWAALVVLMALGYSLTQTVADPLMADALAWGAAQTWSPWTGSSSWLGAVPPVFALALLIAGGAVWRRRTPVEAGILGSLIALAPIVVADFQPPRFFALVAVAVLASALVENAFVLAFHDGLTGLPARRALEERLAQVGRSYALAMLDLDHFKRFNDKHGHEVGDQVLKLVAAQLRRVTGGGEPFRYGGEEFTVLFAGRSASEAKAHMDALRENIAGRKFRVRSPARPKKKPKGWRFGQSEMVTKDLNVTVSIGVAERSDKHGSTDQVMKAADMALYKAKKAGRNRVAVAK